MAGEPKLWVSGLVAVSMIWRFRRGIGPPPTRAASHQPADVPTGTSGPRVIAKANVVDQESGVNKVYLYVDDPTGRNVAGIRMWDDATHGDVVADNTYTADVNLALAAGPTGYRSSPLTPSTTSSKKPVSDLTVVGQQYTWVAVSATPTPTPTATPTASPTPTPTPTLTPTASPTPTPRQLRHQGRTRRRQLSATSRYQRPRGPRSRCPRL